MNTHRTKLQTIYKADAFFSLFSGVALIVLAPFLMPLIAPDVPYWVMMIIGGGLLPWAYSMFQMARTSTPAPHKVSGNLIGDVIWVVASIALLMFAQPWLTLFGNVVIAGTAVIVGELAWLKYRARPSATLQTA